MKLNNMEIKIADVVTPSPAQAAKNILGTVAVEVCADDGSVIARLNGITVRKAKDGTRFLAMPSYQIGEGDNKKYLNHYTIFPGKSDDSDTSKKQRARIDKLATDAIRLLDSGGTRIRGQAPAMAAPAKTASATSKKEPWDV